MDSFKVQFSPKALSMLDDCLAYVNDELMNPQAAESIWTDAIETKDSLIKWATVTVNAVIWNLLH